MKSRNAILFRLLPAGLVCIGLAGFARWRLAKPRPAPVVAAGPSLESLKAELSRLQANARAHPKDAAARWQLATFYQQNNLNEAFLEQLKQITYLEPHSSRAPLLLAQIFLAAKRYGQAETAYREVAAHFPREVQAWQGLASALHEQQRYLEAMDAAKHAVDLQPDDPNNDLLYASASLEYACQFPNPYAYPDELKRAYSLLSRLVRVWPQNGDIALLLARTYGAMHHSKEEIKTLQQAFALLPDRADIAAALVRAQLDNGDAESGKKTVAQALARHADDAQLNALQGRAWEMSATPDAPQQAYLAFQKATQLRPNITSYWEHLGTACLRLQKLEEAQTAFETVTHANPNRSFAYQQLAVVYNRRGNPAMARKAAQMAAAMVFNEQQLKRIQNLSEQHPDDPALHLILADRYKDLRLYSASRDQYLAVLKSDLNNARAKQGLIALAAALQQRAKQAAASSASTEPPQQNISSQNSSEKAVK